MVNRTRILNRPSNLLLAALLLTAAFAFSRVEKALASGGCCGVLGCHMQFNTCNNEWDCYPGEEQCCMGGGCI